MIYLASPYSSPIVELPEQRYKHACQFVDALTAAGFIVFSPIVYYHPIAKRLNMQTDAAAWIQVNMDYLRRAEALYALELLGWEGSKGMKVELNIAKALNMPIVRYDKDFRLLDTQFRGTVAEVIHG